MDDFKETYTILDTEKDAQDSSRKYSLFYGITIIGTISLISYFLLKNLLSIDQDTLALIIILFGIAIIVCMLMVISLKKLQAKPSKGNIILEKEKITTRINHNETIFELAALKELSIVIQKGANQRHYWIGFKTNSREHLYKLDIFAVNEINRFHKQMDYWLENFQNIKVYKINQQQKLEDVIQDSKTKYKEDKEKTKQQKNKSFVGFDIINTELLFPFPTIKRKLVFSHDFDSPTEIIGLMIEIMPKLKWKLSSYDESSIIAYMRSTFPLYMKKARIDIKDKRVVMLTPARIGAKQEFEFFVECLNLLAKKKYAV